MGAEDPGWGDAWPALWVLIPYVGLERMRRRNAAGEVTTLRTIRQVFIGFVMMVALGGPILLWVTLTSRNTPSMRAVEGLILLAAVIAVAGRLLEPELSCASEATLAASYSTRFFLRMAFANAPVLLMFVIGTVSGATVTFAFAALFAIVGYAHAIPSAGRLTREDAALSERGCRWSLVRSLQMRPSAST